MTILQNAIESIALGAEDFQSDDPKRLMSSVRNFYAGILLLFKHKLAQMSSGDDEALIKKIIRPTFEDGELKWKGKGKKTVDFTQIKERFESLSIDIEWDRLRRIQGYRNDIEHYHTNVKPEVVRQYIVDGFVIVRDFIDKHLDKTPRDLLGDDVWECLLNEQKVYDAEKSSCADQMDVLEWNTTAKRWIESATCDECGSDLIRPTSSSTTAPESADFECSVCGKRWDYTSLLDIASSPHDTHEAIKDGIGQVVGVCPDCGNEGYDDIDSECAYCGASGPFECLRCGNWIPVEELSYDDGNLCGWCAHMSQKDD